MKRIVASLLLVSILLSGCMNRSETNAIYLIPEDFVGYALAVYNVKGAPPLTFEDGFSVHLINSDGYFATSEPDMNYGTVTDRYYSVDEKGNRTLIDDLCVHTYGTGGFESHSEEQGKSIDIKYTGIEITDDCSTEFAYSGENFDENVSQTILNLIMANYYDVEGRQ